MLERSGAGKPAPGSSPGSPPGDPMRTMFKGALLAFLLSILLAVASIPMDLVGPDHKTALDHVEGDPGIIGLEIPEDYEVTYSHTTRSDETIGLVVGESAGQPFAWRTDGVGPTDTYSVGIQGFFQRCEIREVGDYAIAVGGTDMDAQMSMGLAYKIDFIANSIELLDQAWSQQTTILDDVRWLDSEKAIITGRNANGPYGPHAEYWLWDHLQGKIIHYPGSEIYLDFDQMNYNHRVSVGISHYPLDVGSMEHWVYFCSSIPGPSKNFASETVQSIWNMQPTGANTHRLKFNGEERDTTIPKDIDVRHVNGYEIEISIVGSVILGGITNGFSMFAQYIPGSPGYSQFSLGSIVQPEVYQGVKYENQGIGTVGITMTKPSIFAVGSDYISTSAVWGHEDYGGGFEMGIELPGPFGWMDCHWYPNDEKVLIAGDNGFGFMEGNPTQFTMIYNVQGDFGRGCDIGSFPIPSAPPIETDGYNGIVVGESPGRHPYIWITNGTAVLATCELEVDGYFLRTEIRPYGDYAIAVGGNGQDTGSSEGLAYSVDMTTGAATILDPGFSPMWCILDDIIWLDPWRAAIVGRSDIGPSPVFSTLWLWDHNLSQIIDYQGSAIPGLQYMGGYWEDRVSIGISHYPLDVTAEDEWVYFTSSILTPSINFNSETARDVWEGTMSGNFGIAIENPYSDPGTTKPRDIDVMHLDGKPHTIGIVGEMQQGGNPSSMSYYFGFDPNPPGRGPESDGMLMNQEAGYYGVKWESNGSRNLDQDWGDPSIWTVGEGYIGPLSVWGHEAPMMGQSEGAFMEPEFRDCHWFSDDSAVLCAANGGFGYLAQDPVSYFPVVSEPDYYGRGCDIEWSLSAPEPEPEPEPIEIPDPPVVDLGADLYGTVGEALNITANMTVNASLVLTAWHWGEDNRSTEALDVSGFSNYNNTFHPNWTAGENGTVAWDMTHLYVADLDIIGWPGFAQRNVTALNLTTGYTSRTQQNLSGDETTRWGWGWLDDKYFHVVLMAMNNVEETMDLYDLWYNDTSKDWEDAKIGAFDQSLIEHLDFMNFTFRLWGDHNLQVWSEDVSVYRGSMNYTNRTVMEVEGMIGTDETSFCVGAHQGETWVNWTWTINSSADRSLDWNLTMDGSNGTYNHTWTKPGNYTVTLTIYDEHGQMATDDITVRISAIVEEETDLLNHTFHLVGGWNLLSMPFVPTSTYKNAVWWESQTYVSAVAIMLDNGLWMVFDGEWLITSFDLGAHRAYMIYATAAHTITIHGTESGENTTTVQKGRSIIGVDSSADGLTASVILARSTGTQLAYLSSSGVWVSYYSGGTGTDFAVVPGRGYFILVPAVKTFSIV